MSNSSGTALCYLYIRLRVVVGKFDVISHEVLVRRIYILLYISIITAVFFIMNSIYSAAVICTTMSYIKKAHARGCAT